MNTITTLIKYKATVSAKGTRSARGRRGHGEPRGRSTSLQRRRAKWAAEGLCLQCGSERPCQRCAARRRAKAQQR
jgi:hypothetical protein